MRIDKLAMTSKQALQAAFGIAEVARRKFVEGDFAALDMDADPNMTL